MERSLSPRISLIVPTYGRAWQLDRLFDSLDEQIFRDFEVIISDQNQSGFLKENLASKSRSFPLTWISSPGERGISRARNIGLQSARGTIVAFPDDDAWYPPDFLDRASRQMEALGVDVLTGRSVDLTGRTINGRFARTAQKITPRGVWIMQIEWASFFSRRAIVDLGGYDEGVGIGCETPWQAAEGPDLILRALSAGRSCYYDPQLVGFHEEYETHPPSDLMTAKARAYARGMGYVLRKNGAGLSSALYWSARPLFQLIVSLLSGQGRRARYFLLVSIGRWEGWTKALWPIGSADQPFTGRDLTV